MTDFVKFGRTGRFELALRWVQDQATRTDRPVHGGSSLGELQIVVGGQSLTSLQQAGSDRTSVCWYLLPVLQWLARHWVPLLHEQRLPWPDRSGAPAATATFLALRRLATSTSEEESDRYAVVQRWWGRHALRAADSSALYPDLFLRRFGDEIEVSWTARQPSYAPDGFRFALTAGVCLLSVAEVAEPIWRVLEWAAKTMPIVTERDAMDREELAASLQALRRLSDSTLEASHVDSRLLGLLEEDRVALKWSDASVRMPDAPALQHLDSAVAMFGGVQPDLGAGDAHELLSFLASHVGSDGDRLAGLIDSDVGLPMSMPYAEGYERADEILEALGLPEPTMEFIDIRQLLATLHVDVQEKHLETRSIRGVAVAGSGYAPGILVNATSEFNVSEEGRRFTLAHEFFHLLFDRSRARRIAHGSTPWAPAAIEKRANAFAARFLMPPALVARTLAEVSGQGVAAAARRMKMNKTALIEHLYNVGLIDEVQRQHLRAP